MNGEEYKTYLASRAWAILRERVRERSGNKCERCKVNGQDAVHHLTYERIGHESLEDLQAICTPCHEFLSGKSDKDSALLNGSFVVFCGDESYDFVTLPEWVQSFEEVMNQDRKLCESVDKFCRQMHSSEIVTEIMKESFDLKKTFVLVTKLANGVRTRIFVNP